MAKSLIILGAGGNCIDILEIVQAWNQHYPSEAYHCVGFLDDNPQLWNQSFFSVPVLGPLRTIHEYSEAYFINGIGSPTSYGFRKSIIASLGVPLQRFVSVVHPTASIAPTAQIGVGTVIFPNVTVMSQVKIGNHVLILPNSVVNHDSCVGDHTCIASGVCISGGVTVGENCYIGTGSSLIGNIQIGSLALIGMGAVVLHSVEERAVMVGNPARLLKKVSF